MWYCAQQRKGNLCTRTEAKTAGGITMIITWQRIATPALFDNIMFFQGSLDLCQQDGIRRQHIVANITVGPTCFPLPVGGRIKLGAWLSLCTSCEKAQGLFQRTFDSQQPPHSWLSVISDESTSQYPDLPLNTLNCQSSAVTLAGKMTAQ